MAPLPLDDGNTIDHGGFRLYSKLLFLYGLRALPETRDSQGVARAKNARVFVQPRSPERADMTIEGSDLRPGSQFEFTTAPRNMAASSFVAIAADRVIVTRRFADLATLPADTPVIAHWHGQRRTDAFLTTVGELTAKADAYQG
jgi:hypothetical protein